MEKQKEIVQDLVQDLVQDALSNQGTQGDLGAKNLKKKKKIANKKVLLLGGNGFIGTYLRKYLDTKGYDVYVLDIHNGIDYMLEEETPNDIHHRNDIHHYWRCNLSELDSTKVAFHEIFDEIGLEGLTIFHLASTVGPSLINIDNSINDFKIHFNIYESIKEEILLRGERPYKMIITGSSESYGDINIMDESKGVNVNVLKEGARPLYALQKLTAETIFLNQGDYDVICTRLFNVVGKGQREDFIFPLLTKVLKNNLDEIRKCTKNFEKFKIYGNGAQSRNFISIDDTVIILEMLIDWQDAEEHIGEHDFQINNSIINISCIQNESTIIHLVHKFLELFRTIIHNGVKYLVSKESADSLTKTEQESLNYLKELLQLPNENFIEFVPGLIGQEKRSPLVYKLYKILKYRPKKDLNTIINGML